MVDRYRLSAGDGNMLAEWYPSVKAAVRFLFTRDTNSDGLLDVRGLGHYLDAWPMDGAAIHVSTYWLSTLAIAERMASIQHDDTFVLECRSWYEKASRSVEEKLWNEQVGSYLLYADDVAGKKLDTVLCDQLIGDMFALLHGLPGVLPPDRVKKVMATLERFNIATTQYGIRLAARPDNIPDESRGAVYYTLIVPSYSTLAVATVMLASGDRHFEELGLEIVRRAWHDLAIRHNMIWDQPCTLKVDGVGGYNLEYYHNTMLWAFPMAVMRQDIKTICAPGGFIHRVRAAGRGSVSTVVSHQ